jgi:hypothetical protein
MTDLKKLREDWAKDDGPAHDDIYLLLDCLERAIKTLIDNANAAIAQDKAYLCMNEQMAEEFHAHKQCLQDQVDALRAQLAEAKEILEEVATMKISWFDGCDSPSDHETRPVKVEIRETIQARKARAFLDKIGGAGE